MYYIVNPKVYADLLKQFGVEKLPDTFCNSFYVDGIFAVDEEQFKAFKKELVQLELKDDRSTI